MKDQNSLSLTRSDTTNTISTDDSSSQSMQDVQQLSPTDSPPSSSVTSTHTRPGTSSSGTGRRRKVPDSVTPNACTTCKKARAKCDGAKPICRRCFYRNLQESCQYELHAKTAKEQMIREIQRLQRKNEHLVEEKDALGEKYSRIEQIMHSLKDDTQGTEIINRLKRGESHKAIAEWLGRPLVGIEADGVVSPATENQISEAILRYHKGLVDNHDPCYWTNVTQNGELINHLISLYFTWVHPVHMLFDEERFMASFRDCKDVYCSPCLVSIICAMSCHLLHNIDVDDGETKAAVESLRRRFMDETRFSLTGEHYGKMTTIQTYAVMFLAEFGSGNGLKASSHLRLATEMLIEKQNAEQSAEAESVSAWGVLTLNTAWSGFVHQKPTAPISTHAKPFSTDIPHYADGVWRVHKQPGDNDSPVRKGLSVMTASEHAKLFRIVHETILVYCGSRGRVRAHHLLDIYGRFLSWKNGLPPELLDVIDEPLPHVLFLHVQYHTALVQLLQPLIHLDRLNRDSSEQIMNLVIHHARAGLRLLVQYRNIYSNFYLSPLQLLCIVELSDALIHYDATSESTPQTLHFCMAALEDAKGGYPVAGPLQKMFRVALADYNIPVPNEIEQIMGPAASLGPEDLLEACTRATYRQPISQILHNMDVNLGEEFIEGWHHLEFREWTGRNMPRAVPGGNRMRRVEIGSLLNS